ncbi:MAG: hypothetical protein LBH25_04670 [Fibromonadaceae bacterium]|nr:hypothetical protein [Fibromonadaceae bacterium]
MNSTIITICGKAIKTRTLVICAAKLAATALALLPAGSGVGIVVGLIHEAVLRIGEVFLHALRRLPIGRLKINRKVAIVSPLLPPLNALACSRAIATALGKKHIAVARIRCAHRNFRRRKSDKINRVKSATTAAYAAR